MLIRCGLECAGSFGWLAFTFLLACSATDDAPALSERPQTISNAPVKENPPSLSSASPSASGSVRNALSRRVFVALPRLVLLCCGS